MKCSQNVLTNQLMWEKRYLCFGVIFSTINQHCIPRVCKSPIQKCVGLQFKSVFLYTNKNYAKICNTADNREKLSRDFGRCTEEVIAKITLSSCTHFTHNFWLLNFYHVWADVIREEWNFPLQSITLQAFSLVHFGVRHFELKRLKYSLSSWQISNVFCVYWLSL